jgi:hypothetical protein
MYMQLPPQRVQWQQIVARKERDTRTWISENLDSTEEYFARRDPNGLVLRVGIRSIRAKELLLRLHQELLSPGFSKPPLSLDESGVWTTWIGYAEPVNLPTHYISMQ